MSLLKLVTVVTFIIEIALPPLFFSPVRSVRIVNFFLQVCNIFKHIFVNFIFVSPCVIDINDVNTNWMQQ